MARCKRFFSLFFKTYFRHVLIKPYSLSSVNYGNLFKYVRIASRMIFVSNLITHKILMQIKWAKFYFPHFKEGNIFALHLKSLIPSLCKASLSSGSTSIKTKQNFNSFPYQTPSLTSSCSRLCTFSHRLHRGHHIHRVVSLQAQCLGIGKGRLQRSAEDEESESIEEGRKR